MVVSDSLEKMVGKKSPKIGSIYQETPLNKSSIHSFLALHTCYEPFQVERHRACRCRTDSCLFQGERRRGENFPGDVVKEKLFEMIRMLDVSENSGVLPPKSSI